jgi:hypothetical protein
MPDQAASNMPLSGNILHVQRPVNLTKNRLQCKNQKNCKNAPKMLGIPTVSYDQSSPLFENARVLVRVDDIARFIINANHIVM